MATVITPSTTSATPTPNIPRFDPLIFPIRIPLDILPHSIDLIKQIRI
jgi:hypothetical protein